MKKVIISGIGHGKTSLIKEMSSLKESINVEDDIKSIDTGINVKYKGIEVKYMTYGDKIRSMTDEELARFFNFDKGNMDEYERVLKLLKSEVNSEPEQSSCEVKKDTY